MKLSLVVKAAGKQEGKVLLVTLSQFVIGRDPQCHLRPASAMISKRHCALVQRDGKAYIQDFGSTNGTFVNEQPIKGEVELHNNDQLKVGPLLFEVRITQEVPAAKGATPKPPTKPIPGVKPSPASAKAAAKTPPPPVKAPPDGAKTAFEMPGASGKGSSAGGNDDDDIAAMLLSLHDDDGAPSAGSDGGVPEGSTVMELILPKPGEDPSTAGDKGKDKEKDKPKPTGNTASAAKSILEQYMRRPRG
jgi:pSer/pThr/pTyr-binding forkhead associated (FHA) protein